MALRGVKVLELAGLAPVPFCGMILADFGAIVTRIDRVGSKLNLDVLANGKKAMSLNLKHPKGVQIFKDLCKQSDVLIEPYRRGIMEKLSLGPDILLKENPKLIYARLTGFGQTGYYADRAGHDINYVSLTGLLSLFRRKNQKPTLPANIVADFGGGGLMCAFGIVSALFERQNSGKGQIIDANMVEGTAYLGSWIYRSQFPPLWGNPPGENILDTGVHFYETYETKDGKYVSVACLESKFYDEFIEQLKLDPNDVGQLGNFEKKKEILSKIFLEKTQQEWCQIFDSKDACVLPVLDIEEAANHPHNIENKSFQRLSDGIVSPNPAPKLSKTPAVSVASKPIPEPNEHTYEILKAINYDDKEIIYLDQLGVIELPESQKIGKSKL